MALVADDLAQGAFFYFIPRDDVLINSFLLPKITGQLLNQPSFMHDVDVYCLPLEDLAANSEPAPSRTDAKVWYFFSPLHNCNADGSAKRKARTISATDGKKWWHSESSKKPVEGAAPRGYFQKFSYKEKTTSGVVKPGWLMVESSSSSCGTSTSQAMPTAATTMPLSISQPDSGSSKRKAAAEHPEAPPPTVQRTSGEEDFFLLAEDALDLQNDVFYFNDDLNDNDNALSMQVMQHTPPSAHGTEEIQGDKLFALPFLGEDCGEFSGGMPGPACAPSCSGGPRKDVPAPTPILDSTCMLPLPEMSTPAAMEPEQENEDGKIVLYDSGYTVDDLFELAGL
ncbi:hypothetical protein GUJ93_ZPchr0013g37811 [Zizania palustris]|uniref:NAC domain-containing protein n=1 Tax=Zizania palustris TaxID=103762 RepID=A0A8J5WWA5_ZIZPA|nr:hypothetical protein GUJ93_ZPchr0013g37811 [Zizania palustris]